MRLLVLLMMRGLDGLTLPTSQEFEIVLETGIRLNRLFLIGITEKSITLPV